MGTDSELLTRLEAMINVLIERNNMLEDKIQRLGFDVRFIQAWIDENRKTASPDAPESTKTG